MLCLPLVDFLCPRRLPPWAGCALLLLGLSPVTAAVPAPKTDVVVFQNGDRLTGEVKGLERGKLSFKTDAAGTLSIEWAEVTRLQSSQVLQIELASGARHSGHVPDASEPGTLLVVADNADKGREFALVDVIRMDPIDQGKLVARLDGYLSAGYDYSKANALQTFTFTSGLSLRDERALRSLDGSTTITTQDAAEDSQRFDLTGGHRRFLANRRFWQGFVGFDGNDVLGLDLRTTVGGAYGTYLVQSPKQEWAVFAGLAATREDFATQEMQEGLEALVGTQYSFFRFRDPEASLDASLMVLPSLTESGRVRSEMQLRSRYEIAEDLFFEVSTYYSYDTDADVESEKSDYGLTTSLGYSF